MYTVWSVVISYIIKSFVDLCDSIIIPDSQMNASTTIIVCIIVSIILAIICSKMFDNKKLRSVLNFINHKSVNSDIWRDIVDYDNGTTLKIFLKNGITYIGVLIIHEENGKDSWFALKGHCATYPDGTEFNSCALADTDIISTVAIQLSNVDRIELYYNKDTKIFD